MLILINNFSSLSIYRELNQKFQCTNFFKVPKNFSIPFDLLKYLNIKKKIPYTHKVYLKILMLPIIFNGKNQNGYMKQYKKFQKKIKKNLKISKKIRVDNDDLFQYY
ncbi:hypothetical protein pb186bvf_001497 [Paramecium bursaria]